MRSGIAVMSSLSCAFCRPDRPELTRARLAMISAVQTVLAGGLELIGVTPVEELV